jgi:glutamine synthetase adenylyltransferase
LPDDHCHFLDNILARPVVDDELNEYQVQLRELCKIHKFSSRYFHRFFHRVISNHPEYLRSLTNVSQLFKIASGLLAMVDVYPDHVKKKEVLGDYYDLEFLRVGIGTIRGVDLSITNKEFTEFCDNYMRKLFDICTEEVERDAPSVIPSTDSFAILAAGGHARNQAYDDDYDLIAVVDTDDKDVIRYATKVVTKMNREILKRGVLPHYRLGEILEGFVTPLSKIIEYLSSGDEESFIDLSQLLGARMIVGSDVMKSVIKSKILARFVYNKRSSYIQRMITEVRSRQELIGDCTSSVCNIKETRGGLRDIEAVALMLKAYIRYNKPLTQNFFLRIKPQFPDISQELDILSQTAYLLRTIRNLYRITIAAEDNIYFEDLKRLAAIFFQSSHPEWENSNQFFNQVQITLQNSANACEQIVNFLDLKTQ